MSLGVGIQPDFRDLLQEAGASPARYGRGKWTCPECGRPDLAVNPAKQVFNCFHHGCSFKGGIGALWKRLNIGRQWLPHDEYLRQVAERQRASAKADATVRERQEAAMRKALYIWTEAAEAPADHPYLARKGIQPHGARLWRDSLVIRMRDGSGDLRNLQFISADGEKRFLRGGQVNGCCLDIGSLGKRMWVTEGFATGGTIHEATGDPVAVCFSANNLAPVLSVLRPRFPKTEIILAADNDANTPGNPGQAKAIQACQRFGVRAVWPTFPDGSEGTDFNLLAQEIGLAGVRTELEAALELKGETQ